MGKRQFIARILLPSGKLSILSVIGDASSEAEALKIARKEFKPIRQKLEQHFAKKYGTLYGTEVVIEFMRKVI